MRSEDLKNAPRRKNLKKSGDRVREPTFEELGESPAIGMLPNGKLNVVDEWGDTDDLDVFENDARLDREEEERSRSDPQHPYADRGESEDIGRLPNGKLNVVDEWGSTEFEKDARLDREEEERSK